LALPEAPWLEALVQDLPAGLRPFCPGDLHCTVAFLGPVGAPAAHRAFRALHGRAHAPFQPTVAELRPFGPPNRPSAFSLALEDAALTAWIHDARRDACLAAGVKEDPRPVAPHVTVARPTRSSTGAQLEAAKGWCARAGPLPKRLSLPVLALYTWSNDRRARLFDLVAQRPLGGPLS
jgi:2'-5' RNA ligase